MTNNMDLVQKYYIIIDVVAILQTHIFCGHWKEKIIRKNDNYVVRYKNN